MMDGGTNTMNKNINKALFLISISAYSISNADVDKNIMQDIRKQALIRNGFNANGSPKIVSSSEINVDEKIKEQWKKEKNEIDKKGYFSEKTYRSTELLLFKDNLSMNAIVKNKKNSSLKQNLNEIQLAYEAKPVSNVQSLAFAESGGYSEIDPNKKGYSGFVQFFEYGELGVCAYTEDNTKISLGAVKISEDRVTYDVNGKVTLINNKGQEGYGFVYDVEWFGEGFFKQLECASKSYSQEMSEKTIELAKMIDSQS